MKLTEGERRNPLMATLIVGWTEELAFLRVRNDGPLTHDETLTLRGRIAQMKVLIALGDKPPVIEE